MGTSSVTWARPQLVWAAVAAVLLAVGAAEIAHDRWDSPWPVSVLTLLLVGVPVAVVARRPVLAATVLCLAFGLECLLWSTPHSLAALLALASVAAGAARYAPARSLPPVLGLLALTVVVVLVPDPGEDAAFDYVLTSLLCAGATGGGLLARSGRQALLGAVTRGRRATGTTRSGGVALAPDRPPHTTTVFVHVGLPKTGTSYLQSVCERSADVLRDHGLELLPRGGTTAFRVMLDVRDELRAELDPPEHFGALDRLADDVAGLTSPRGLLSQELLSLASREQAEKLLAALDGAEVHLVVTVRDLARQLPSLWQQQVKARGVTSFEGFLDRITSDDPGRSGPGTGAPRGYDLPSVLEQWRGLVPPQRTHVVVVPRAGSATGLPARFFGVLGIDPAVLDTEQGEANQSLGLPQAELLRRVNLALGDRLPHARAGYRGPGKRFLAETILIRQDAAPPRLPARVRPWVEERSRRVVEDLRAHPYDVVGDLDELLPDPAAFDEEEREVTDAELVETATEALAAILTDRAERAERGRERH